MFRVNTDGTPQTARALLTGLGCAGSALPEAAHRGRTLYNGQEQGKGQPSQQCPAIAEAVVSMPMGLGKVPDTDLPAGTLKQTQGDNGSALPSPLCKLRHAKPLSIAH